MDDTTTPLSDTLRLRGPLARAVAAHDARHRPSGFGLALADRVDALDPAAWATVTAEASVLLQRPYLAAVESAGLADIAPRYALIYAGRRPVAAVVARLVPVGADQLLPGRLVGRRLAGALRERVLVCGDLVACGPYGIAVAPGVEPDGVWPGVAEALYRIRRADRLGGPVDVVAIKDLAEGDGTGLAPYGYQPVETEPEMVLAFPPGCRTFVDYVTCLGADARRALRRVDDAVRAAGGRVAHVPDVRAEAVRLQACYLDVLGRAASRPVTLPVGYLPAVAEALGDRCRVVGLWRDDRLVGFVTVLRDADTAVGLLLGYDRAATEGVPVYLRLLHAAVAEALALGARRLALGRTALAPKAGLGALPEPRRIWVRHRVTALTLAATPFLRRLPHAEPPARHPFRAGVGDPVPQARRGAAEVRR